MILSTKTTIAPVNNPIVYGDGILFLGSCFADEVGSLSKGLGFNAMVNPFGVLFNPKSIANAVERLSRNIPFTHNDVIKVNDEFYCTFSHGTAFWQQDKKTLLDKVNDDLETASRHFKNASHIVISLGTSWVYQHKESGKIVANCHKMPAAMFEERILTTEEIVRRFDSTCRRLMELRPELKIIVSVSPYRYLKYGLHTSQLSKARLLLATDEIQRRHNAVHYFPAYEIMNDELRDYRFYAADMVHPSETAEEYIWQTFCDHYMSDRMKQFMREWAPLLKQKAHRTKNPAAQQALDDMLNSKMQQVKKHFPEMKI